MKKASICVVTGTRAEFGIWRPVLRAIVDSRRLQLQLVVTGMHLQKGFGNTVKDIEHAGLPIAARVAMYKGGDEPGASLARGTLGMAKAFRRLKPDLVMVLGDRLEILAAANAALACQIPLAHVHGGETAPGQWDEQIRHAVSKMAHLHFCATAVAARRIRQMGEDPSAIHQVGAPALDAALRFLRDRPGSVAGKIVVLLHPTSADVGLEEKRMGMVLGAVGGRTFEVLGPNNDPGYRGILRACERRGIGVTMSLPQEEFWGLLAAAPALVGNSSAGILEAASFGVPVINIGERQAGRERNGNVMDVRWEAGRAGIERGLQKALHDAAFRRGVARGKNLYGDGGAAGRIVGVLRRLRFPLGTAKRWHSSGPAA